MSSRRRRRERGFTIMELLIALLVSSLLVGMILAIFMRMSLAYRGQQEVTSVQQLLSAARGWMEQDAKQAGYGVAQGFSIATDPTRLHAPVEIVNSNAGPDQVSFYYGDPTSQAVVSGITTWTTASTVDVDDASAFAPNQIVVMTTPSLTDSALSEGKIVSYEACVLQIETISLGTPNKIKFSNAAPWGTSTNGHCTTPTAARTMIFKFVARSYRIDPNPARAADGVLQLSKTGVLNSSVFFEDIGMGFTDLQVAGYFFDNDAADTPDPDTDALRDWYSSTDMETKTLPITKGGTGFTPMLQLAVSIVARTSRNREGIGTASTPPLTDPVNVTNNMLGDRDTIDVTTTTDPHLLGNRLYRHTTFYVDLRNVGVGR